MAERLTTSQKGQGGFTLVEMAIVLVIIGLIIGAIMKGQDLIDNARAKRASAFIRSGEVAQWTYLDRMGRFAGNVGVNNGTAATDPAAELAAELTNFSESVQLGSSTLYIRYGTRDTGSAVAGVKGKAFIAIFNTAGSVTAANAFSTSERSYAKAFDTAIDGAADATKGKVVGLIGAVTVPTNKNILGLADSAIATNTDWGATASTITGLLYYFDSGQQ